jgi:hypothetical protein
MHAPLKEWTVASFSDTGSASSYFDTKKECDARRKRLALADQKACFPVEELKRHK